MSRFLVLCLILADTFVVLAAGAKTEHKMALFSFTDAPAPSLGPSFKGKSDFAKDPTIRKLGKHQKEALEFVAAGQGSIPSQAPSEAYSLGQEKEMSKMHLEMRHHNIDKSIAGGGIILGGLATTFLVAVFRYIRATRRKSVEPSV